MTVYFVIGGTGMGITYAVFADYQDADDFKKFLNNKDARKRCVVKERTLHYGQPPILGYNK